VAPDVFDDLEVLRATTPQLTPRAPSGSPRRRQLSSESFARIPHTKGLALHQHNIGSVRWTILLELDRLIFEARGRNPVSLTNHHLRQYGVDRAGKWRALRKLEAAGVIAIERRGRESPLITHLWFPVHD
jgi:hypothetical protein